MNLTRKRMKCEHCGNNPIKTKPNATQLESLMIPTDPWIPFLRWTFFVGIVVTVLFYLVIEPQTGLDISFGFVPLFSAGLDLSFLINILVFSQTPFLCKLCGHTQQLQEVQELKESCRQCKGHKFIRKWSYPIWVKVISILLAVSSVAALIFLVISLVISSPISFYLTTIVGGIWVILFFILEMRKSMYRLLFTGSDMNRALLCTNCGMRQ